MLVAAGKTATVKAKKVKKKAQTVAASKLYSYTDAGQGFRVFSKVSGNGKIVVNSNGNITVKKGLKKGTYKVDVAVIATGDATHSASDPQIVTVTIRVK